MLATPFSLGGTVRAGLSRRHGPDLFRIDSSGRLVLRCLRTYTFSADEVVAIEREAPSWYDAGVRIVHNRADYPRRISFRAGDGSDAIDALLRDAGFVPRGTGPAGRSSFWLVPYLLAAAIAVHVVIRVLEPLLW